MEKNMFLDEAVDIQRYDELKYPQLDKITEKQLGFFWRPEEVDISKDKKDFDSLTEHEKHIFTSNLKRQIVLDSVQGRAPNLAFLPIASLPEVENWIECWSFFETIHSKSYTHIIRNIYPSPGVVFDTILNTKEISNCADSISTYYDDLVTANHGPTNKMDHKRAICSWAFAELKKMEGNAKIIKFIARDENVHLASTTTMLKLLQKEDKDFVKIAKEMEDASIRLYVDVIEQEKAWAEYLFKDGSMIGLNAKLLSDYIEWIGCKRMRAIGLHCPYTVSKMNPLPWTEKWIGGGNVQVAPQETEITSYITGGVKQDVTTETMAGLSL
jgi:ribonucleoside-diphosphate reductase beta chain